MRKASLYRFFVLEIFYTCFQGLVHPITPTIFKNLLFPDYVFGVVSAATATGMFLFSPLWGRWGDKIGHSKAFSIALPMYAIFQLAFGLSKTPHMTIITRFFSGLSGGGAMVVSMAYIVNITNFENRGKVMSYFVALNTVAGSIGYFIGGVLGNVSISAVFIVQITSLCLISLFNLIFVEDPKVVDSEYKFTDSVHFVNKSANIKSIMSKSLFMILIAVFLTSLASYSYDSSFNYYIKAELNLPPTYNGIIKAITGIVGLIVNFTVNIYLVKKTNIKKSIIPVLVLCGVFSMIAPFWSSINMFFLWNIFYYMFNSIYMPIQQIIVMKSADKKSSGLISGLFNSIKSVGMIMEALSVGFLYSIKSKLPFIIAALAFFLAALVCIFNYLYSRELRQIESRNIIRTSCDTIKTENPHK